KRSVQDEESFSAIFKKCQRDRKKFGSALLSHRCSEFPLGSWFRERISKITHSWQFPSHSKGQLVGTAARYHVGANPNCRNQVITLINRLMCTHLWSGSILLLHICGMGQAHCSAGVVPCLGRSDPARICGRKSDLTRH